jgi:hypothetical protein
MTTRASTLRRSKVAENKVIRYFAGEQALRSWKDEWDISLKDHEGNIWTGEVKAHEWPASPGRFVALMHKALEQAEGYNARFAFACYAPKGSEAKSWMVCVRAQGVPVIVTADTFRVKWLGSPAETEEDGQQEAGHE